MKQGGEIQHCCWKLTPTPQKKHQKPKNNTTKPTKQKTTTNQTTKQTKQTKKNKRKETNQQPKPQGPFFLYKGNT